MNRKTQAVLLELVPIISAILGPALVVTDWDGPVIRWVIRITFLLAALGFLFFFAGRKLEPEDKLVRFLGILDLCSILVIMGIYVLAFVVFAW